MNRTLTAAAFATALLPMAALEAAAASRSHINRTYTLACQAGATDSVSLNANQIILRNTTPHAILERTVIRLILRDTNGRIIVRRVSTSESILRGARWSAGSAAGIRFCNALVTLQPNLRAKIETKIKISR